MFLIGDEDDAEPAAAEAPLVPSQLSALRDPGQSASSATSKFSNKLVDQVPDGPTTGASYQQQQEASSKARAPDCLPHSDNEVCSKSSTWSSANKRVRAFSTEMKVRQGDPTSTSYYA
jgi:hypothetical protein